MPLETKMPIHSTGFTHGAHLIARLEACFVHMRNKPLHMINSRLGKYAVTKIENVTWSMTNGVQ